MPGPGCPESRGDPQRHHSELEAGRERNREGTRRHPEGDAGGRDKPAGGGFRSLALGRLSGNSTG